MKDHVNEVKSQVLENIGVLITTAFGLIAALAWNEAIKALIVELIGKGNGITGLFIYAIIITVLAIVTTIIIGKIIAKPVVQEVRIVE
ncbi:MAG: DUF5654 family protein [Methanobacteriaceae archaeon]|nr:DUF5654 family protein [Methanobacteriaceae archaeon]MDP2837410.1 DUF5654 family protein [Methanobacteriaceae archaeon]MDP3035267.1 DUF5654 family protein [Methanobacteriaceae archaeon]MDP3486072.1 DUF5654 family protein [Methanobacteriaceae archaeon]MDP3623748.1 DUF5654 family protein [Methanobacteriaceae archaeon]